MARPRPGRWCSARIPTALPQPELSVGYPHPQVALRLVDGERRDADQGVLEMKCPALMLGYHNRPDVAPPFTADGFYVTGDVFRRDGDGFHYFVGRTDDMFVSGGENIYPADVERMLERHPGRGAGLRGADRGRDQGPEAGRLHRAEARAARRPRTRSSASRWPMRPPISIRASCGSLDELPLASTNKIDRAALRSLALERLGTGVPGAAQHGARSAE